MIEANYNSKNILLLEIGRSDTKLYALDTSKIHDTDRELVKTSKEILKSLDSHQRYQWLKDNCKSLKDCYRTYSLNKMKIINTHEL